MASSLFPTARDQLVAGTLDWTAGVIRGVMLPEGVVFDYTMEYLEDIPAGQRIATSAPFESRAKNAGWYTARPVSFGGVLDTRRVAQVVIFLDTGNEATSLLIAHLDDEGIIGDPFVPMGVEYFLYPDAAFGGFFFFAAMVAPVLSVETVASQPQLDWTAASCDVLTLLRYHVFRSIDGAAFEEVAELHTSVLTYTDPSPLPVGVSVQYYVEARFDVSAIEPAPGYAAAASDTVEFGLAEVTAPVLTMLGQATAGAAVLLEWTAAVPDFGTLDGYRVQRRVNGGAFALIDTLANDDLDYSDPYDFEDGDLVEYRIVAFLGSNVVTSNVEGATIVGPLAIVGHPVIGAALNETRVGNPLTALRLAGTVAWSIESGAIPTDWDLNTSTGAIGGVASETGVFTYTLRATGLDPISGNAAYVEQEFVTRIGTIISLLHFDGANGSTSFPDETGKVWTASDVSIITDLNALGGAAATFDGSARLEIADSSDWAFGTDDFTVEAFVTRMGTNSSGEVVLSQRTTVSSNHAFTWRHGPSGINRFGLSSSGTSEFGSVAYPTPVSNARTFYSFCRRGGRFYCHVDGVLASARGLPDGEATAIYNSTANVKIAAWDGPGGLIGRMDEFKVVRGAALYAETETYTPRTVESDFPVT